MPNMILWQKTFKTKEYGKLDGHRHADVVIIGGGITGLLNAYYLSKIGKKVVLIEKNTLGSNATICTTAFITKVIDSELSEIVSLFGKEKAMAVWNSGQAAVEEFARIINDEKIDCEFKRCSNFIYSCDQTQFNKIEEEYKQYKKYGMKATLHSDGKALGIPNFGYMEIPNQAKFHIIKFLYKIAELAVKNGAKIYEHTEAIDVSTTSPVTVKTKCGEISAKDVLIATYQPLSNEKTHLKKGMYRSYIIQIDLDDDSIPEAIYEDMSNPYYYFRVDRNGKNRMLLGGADHKDIFGSSLNEISLKALEEYASKILPAGKFRIVDRWDGPILEPSDGLPLIGMIKPHFYVATAFSGNGMTYSMISALIIRDLIQGKENPWVSAYDPKRALLHPKRLAFKARDYVEEFFGGAFRNLLRK